MEYSSQAQREKTSVALSSVLAAVFITGLKLVVGISTGSLGILSEAVHSGLDLAAAVITLFAVRFSARPADASHPYGHGKIENISALVETVLLFVTCVWIISEAIQRLLYHARDIQVNFWSFFVIILSVVVDYSRSRALSKAAKKHESQALEADALHFSTDIWSSLVVLAGLILTLLKIPVADSVAALIVALIVMYVSLALGKRTIDDLLDSAPRGMEEAIHALAMGMPGVERADGIRVRRSGSRMFVDLTLGIRRTLPFEQADELVHQVEVAVRKKIPNAEILIHPEPVPTGDESIAEKVKLIVARDRLIAHDVQTFFVDGKYRVEFQLEFQGGKDFAEAHRRADEIEARIKRELPDLAMVIVHLEDSKERVLYSVDVTPSSQELIRQVQRIALGRPPVRECTILSVLDVQGRYDVSMVISVDKNLSLEEAHMTSTELENMILVALPSIREVHIHAQPAK